MKQATKKEIRIATVMIIVFILVFIVWIYFDFMRLKECSRAIELLGNKTIESNYCQSWCLVYD